MFEVIIGLIAGLIGLAYLYTRKIFSSWQKVGVVVPPYSNFIGHTTDLLLKPERWEYIDKSYHQFKKEPYFGLYEMLTPCLVLRDRDLIKDVMVKEADSFIDRRDVPFRPKFSIGDDIFSSMLLHTKGDKWKKLRALMSPTFTSGKIKAMFQTISSKADQLTDFLDEKMEDNPIVEIRNPLGKYTLGVISSCAFGLQTSFTEESSVFNEQAEKFSTFGTWIMFKMIAVSFTPSFLLDFLGMGILSDNYCDYYSNIVEHTISERKKKNIRREDFLDLMEDCLQESMKSGDAKYQLSTRSIIAQSLLFILAGYDTTSNSLSTFFFLMAKNKEAQEELRKEVQEIYDQDDELNYQNVMEAKYLDACFSECLRMYGPAHFVERKCTTDFKFEKTGLTVKQGTFVTIPSWSLHYDEEYWDEPRSFKPERFFPENKDKIVPYTYLPFGSGPRNCIGMRFALLEAKLVIAKMMHKYRFSLPNNEDKLIFNKNDPFTLRLSEHGVRIHFEKL